MRTLLCFFGLHSISNVRWDYIDGALVWSSKCLICLQRVVYVEDVKLESRRMSTKGEKRQLKSDKKRYGMKMHGKRLWELYRNVVMKKYRQVLKREGALDS